MTDDEIKDFLTTARTLQVATIGPTGHPHLVAMWFVLFEGMVAFWTFGKSRKIKNLRRDDKISALAEDGTTYDTLRGVQLLGRGRIIDDAGDVLELGTRVALKYNGEAAISDAAKPFLQQQAAKRLGVVIDVDKIVSWDHRKLAGTH